MNLINYSNLLKNNQILLFAEGFSRMGLMSGRGDCQEREIYTALNSSSTFADILGQIAHAKKKDSQTDDAEIVVEGQVYFLCIYFFLNSDLSIPLLAFPEDQMFLPLDFLNQFLLSGQVDFVFGGEFVLGLHFLYCSALIPFKCSFPFLVSRYFYLLLVNFPGMVTVRSCCTSPLTSPATSLVKVPPTGQMSSSLILSLPNARPYR